MTDFYARCEATTGSGERCSRTVAKVGDILCTQHAAIPRSEHKRGWWNMTCFNGLSAEQQDRVVNWGNLPFGYEPGGRCLNGAEVEITTMWDTKPGPRFYCRKCAVEYVAGLWRLAAGQPPVVLDAGVFDTEGNRTGDYEP